jgi:hypothetical protein
MLGANPLPGIHEVDFNNTNTTNASPLVPTTEALSVQFAEEQNETRLVVNETKVADEFVCAFYNPDFIIYSSLGSFYIPCVIMVFLYIRIFSVSKLYTYSKHFIMHNSVSLVLEFKVW